MSNPMDKKEVLFEVTKDNIETGLRGYPVGYCTTSFVDPIKGLTYVEHPIDKLANWQPERVIYMLYYKREGTNEEVKAFTQMLKERAFCSPKVHEHIRSLPKEGEATDLFAMALILCGIYEGKHDYREDCLNLIAKAPIIAAEVINHHAGWGPSKPSKPELGYIENFVHMLNIPGGATKELIEVFKLFNVLHYDHGGGNLSTFVGKAVASSLEDLYGSLAAAMCALAGPRHGRANQDTLAFVKNILNQIGENASSDEIESLIRRMLTNGEVIYGFGHAVLRVEDPRATIFYDFAEKHYSNHPLVKITKLLRTHAPNVLKENPKISDPYPNVDGISGTLLSAAGFPYPEYFTVLFGMARVVGIAIQIVYERCEARDGKGTPIIRPKYIFKSAHQKN